jgi:hypothetical protein
MLCSITQIRSSPGSERVDLAVDNQSSRNKPYDDLDLQELDKRPNIGLDVPSM